MFEFDCEAVLIVDNETDRDDDIDGLGENEGSGLYEGIRVGVSIAVCELITVPDRVS